MNAARGGRDAPHDRATLFHLAVRDEWHATAAEDTYAPAAFAAESFVHCSYRDQLPGVRERYYTGRTDLVVLEIDRAALEAVVGAGAVLDEPSPLTGELFPHVYAQIPRAIVREVHGSGSVNSP